MKTDVSNSKSLKKTALPELREAYQKVLRWFFSYPDKEIGLTDLSVALEISKTTAKIIVKQLVAENFLAVEFLGKLWRISCNKSHAYNVIKKISYNLELIYSSGILEEINKLFPNPRAVVLFGSYRKGDDTENSDIDIAVEILGNEEPKIVELGVIPQFGYRKNIKINLLKFSRNKIDLNLFSNVVNGIVLYGVLEARP